MSQIGNKFRAKNALDLRCCFVALLGATIQSNDALCSYLKMIPMRKNTQKERFLLVNKLLNISHFQLQLKMRKTLIMKRLGNARSIR